MAKYKRARDLVAGEVILGTNGLRRTVGTVSRLPNGTHVQIRFSSGPGCGWARPVTLGLDESVRLP